MSLPGGNKFFPQSDDSRPVSWLLGGVHAWSHRVWSCLKSLLLRLGPYVKIKCLPLHPEE